MSTRPRLALALAGLGVLVALLHGWVIDRLAAAPLPAAARSPGAAQPVQASLREVPVPRPEPAREEPLPVAAAETAVVAAPIEPPSPRPKARKVAVPLAEPATSPPVEVTPVLAEAPPPAAEAPPADAEQRPALLPLEPVALLAAAAAPSAEATAAPPTYRTRIPPAARLNYRLSRGGLVGSGELDWRPQGKNYSLRLEGRMPLVGTLIVQTSSGGFDAAGLAPERHTDKRLKRGEQAANFQRERGSVTFSGPSTELALLPGMQDRLSVMLQLAAIANAWRKPPAMGEHVLIQVVGARGDAHLWSLRYEGPQAVQTAEGSVASLRFLREPAGPYDTRAEFWLDGARSYLPVRVRLTDGRGDTLELLREAPVP